MKSLPHRQNLMRVALIMSIGLTLGNAVMATFGVDIPYRSEYVWRGAVFNDEAVLWPDAWLNWHGFTAGVWGSFDLTDVKNEQMTFTDIALSIDYTTTLGPLNATIGFAQYTYPGYNNAFPSTGEAYVKLNGSLQVIQASLAGNFDLEEVDGWYLSPAVAKSFTLGPVTPTVSVSCGLGDKHHNLYYYGQEITALADLTATLKMSYPLPGSLGKYLSLSGDFNYSRIIDPDLAPDENGEIYWGLGLNAYFAP